MSDEVYRIPVVLVMSLISKPYILDLTPGVSFVEFLLKQGFDVFMIDWGVPRPEDSKLKLEDYTHGLHPGVHREDPGRRRARRTSRSSATAWAGCSR